MAMQTPIEESCIPTFMAQYNQKKYAELAKRVADLCNQALSKNGISLQTKSRGKEPDSLRTKLEGRERERGPYKDSREIYDEIIDLAGARIILNHSEDRYAVKSILYDIFEVSKEKNINRESGYKAVHYIVYLKQGRSLPGLRLTQARIPVEIQVQSHGTWQWSEIEHEAIYKAKRDPSLAMKSSLKRQIGLANLQEESAEETRQLKAMEDAKHEEKLAKSKEKLQDPNSVGYYLGKWIFKRDVEWAKGKSGNLGSATALTKFLDSREWRTAECLGRLLHKHLGDGAQNEYSKLAKEYAGIELNLIIYLIDCEILKAEGDGPSAFRQLNSDETHLHKIRVILSAFIWMNRLFFPSFERHCLLTRIKDRVILRPGILWLSNSARQCDIEDGASLNKSEILKLNELWNWFSGNRDRPIRLAFTMSRLGAMRNIPKEKEELDRALKPLTEALS